MASGNFAIVCDCGCDLPAGYVTGRGVALVSLEASADCQRMLASADDLAAAYRAAVDSGYTQIVSVHTTELLCNAAEQARIAASELEGVRIEVLDTGVATAACGLVAQSLVAMREEGLTLDEALPEARKLASGIRVLCIPEAHSRLGRRRPRHVRTSVVNRAAAVLRSRLVGERGLFLLREGVASELMRSADFDDLNSRLAQTMSALAVELGDLVYVTVETGDERANRNLKKHLNTNEFDARCVGSVHACDALCALMGRGAVAVAVVAAELFDRFSHDTEGAGLA